MSMPNSPVWLITGCSTGFGRELAKLIIEQGGKVIVTARSRERVADLVEGVEDRALAQALDVTDDAQIRKEKSFYTGKTIRTLSEDEFHVHRGSYTTCDQEHPHFDFYSPRIMVLADEMAIARPVYLRVAEKRGKSRLP